MARNNYHNIIDNYKNVANQTRNSSWRSMYLQNSLPEHRTRQARTGYYAALPIGNPVQNNNTYLMGDGGSPIVGA